MSGKGSTFGNLLEDGRNSQKEHSIKGSVWMRHCQQQEKINVGALINNALKFDFNFVNYIFSIYKDIFFFYHN